MIKIGDKVRCVDSDGLEERLSIGKIYEVVNIVICTGIIDDLIYIVDNMGFETAFKCSRFEIATEYKVVHPSHYNQGKIECWDYIVDHRMGFLDGNVVKYITRYADKNGLEDLRKAKEYLDKLIEVEEMCLDAK